MEFDLCFHNRDIALLVFHAIQLAKLFQHVIEDVYPLASVKGQDIGVVSQNNVTILADETEIYTLIKTFLDNAIRYTPDDSQIEVAIASLKAVLPPEEIKETQPEEKIC